MVFDSQLPIGMPLLESPFLENVVCDRNLSIQDVEDNITATSFIKYVHIV